MRLGMKVRQLASIAAATAAIAFVSGSAAMAQAPNCSVWLVESSRFMKVPFGAFMPDRAFVPGSTNPNNNIPTVDLPANMLDEVRLLISQNRKIEAIKRVREATHLGLSEAKDLVERL